MLLELNIKNFAIIKDLEVSFDNGLNIITGETGTGKSILIEALGVLLGSRTNRDFIRNGEEEANLEAVFYVKENYLDSTLESFNIDMAEDRLLIINKNISRNGPTISKINGRNVNLNMLNIITKKLVDIFGQHEHQSLLDVSKHINLLDSFGDEKFIQLKGEIREKYSELREMRNHLDKISMDTSSRDREIDILKYQISEIEDANLDWEKDEKVEEEFKKYSKLNGINLIFSNILKNLDSHNDFEHISIIDIVTRNVLELEGIKEVDENILLIYERFKSLGYELEDLKRECISYVDSLEVNPNYLIELEERLDLLNRLKSKYGTSFTEVLDFKTRSEERLFSLLNQESEILKIKEDILEVEKILLEKSKKVSDYRKDIALVLEYEIQRELEYLNMKEIKFKVDFKELKDFSETGRDRVEFLIATNLGEGLKPLSKIASGGEMSRIMLAFKSILAEYDDIQTMIFDEIDTGISGRTAQVVGEKIYEISKNHQVICISHLPQITAMADSHYSINKEIIGNKTGSYIEKLDYENRIRELARLIGGAKLTDTTLKHAVEMIEMCNDLKSKI